MPPRPALSTEEQRLQERTKGKRLFQLDALRGLAAACVVLYHLRYAFVMQIPYWPLTPIFAGHSAVVLFFVLSGYVLSLPYWGGEKRPYVPYMIRRFCRIYLPFFCAALLSMAGAAWFYGSHLPLTPWFQLTWQTPVTWALAVKQLLMWPMAEFNTAFWSLRFEMQMSALMPFLCMLMRRWSAVWIAVVSLLIAFAKPSALGVLHWHLIDQSIEIASLFVLGAMLARYREELRVFFERVGAWQWFVLAISLVLYYEYPIRVFHGPLRAAFQVREDLMVAVGSAGIILCSLHLRPFARVLEHRLPEYLGRISYSLYLVHGVVIFGLLNVLYGKLRFALLTGVVLAACMIAAELFYLLIEEPSMKLGKRLT